MLVLVGIRAQSVQYDLSKNQLFVKQIQNIWSFRFEILDMDLGLDNNPTEVNYGWKMVSFSDKWSVSVRNCNVMFPSLNILWFM